MVPRCYGCHRGVPKHPAHRTVQHDSVRTGRGMYLPSGMFRHECLLDAPAPARGMLIPLRPILCPVSPSLLPFVSPFPVLSHPPLSCPVSQALAHQKGLERRHALPPTAKYHHSSHGPSTTNPLPPYHPLPPTTTHYHTNYHSHKGGRPGAVRRLTRLNLPNGHRR